MSRDHRKLMVFTMADALVEECIERPRPSYREVFAAFSGATAARSAARISRSSARMTCAGASRLELAYAKRAAKLLRGAPATTILARAGSYIWIIVNFSYKDATMGLSLTLALRYLRSRKQAFISVSTLFAIAGVALGTAALSVVMSVTGGFRAEFRDKVLGTNGHVIVLKYASHFREYREVMAQIAQIPEVIGVGPFSISPMMLTYRGRTATSVTVKAVDPERLGSVLDLPRYIVEGSIDGLARPGARDGEPPAPDSGWSAPAEAFPTEPIPAEAVPAQATPGPARRATPDLAPGSIVPEGGYSSVLPEDDVLPEELDPDPCAGSAARLPGIIVGAALKDALGVKLGDCVQVTSPTIGYSFVAGSMRPAVAKQFRVTAVFQAGFEQYDSRFVYTDLEEARAFYGGDDSVTGIEIKLRDLERAPEVAREIEERLDNAVYQVVDWEELNRGLFTALEIQQILMSLVLALIILVAAFTVIATLIMVVLEKKQEIAVLKAMGASDGALLAAFLYQGLFVGLTGTALGASAGYAICRWILAYGFPLDPKVYFISRLPVQIRPTEFALTAAFALVSCLAATLWPALHAARLRPVDALRDG